MEQFLDRFLIIVPDGKGQFFCLSLAVAEEVNDVSLPGCRYAVYPTDLRDTADVRLFRPMLAMG